jgi:hypothetical protein
MAILGDEGSLNKPQQERVMLNMCRRWFVLIALMTVIAGACQEGSGGEILGFYGTADKPQHPKLLCYPPPADASEGVLILKELICMGYYENDQ